MEYKGEREIKVDDVTNAFFARAASAILDDLEFDFDLAEIVYGDEEEIDLDIDGEDWVICYDQDEDGFHFHLLTGEEFDDQYYQYAAYDDDDSPEDEFNDEDWFSDIDGEENDEEYEGSRIIQASEDVSIFHIMSLASVLDGAEIDFEVASIEQANNQQMTVDIDGDKVVLGEKQEDGNRYLAFLEGDDEDKEKNDENSEIIPFHRR